MVQIHTSTHVPLDRDKEFSLDSVPKDLRNCAETLRNIAETYTKMADTIEAKNIKISSVGGTASVGSFEVDEIDAGRLRVAGLLFDVRAKPASSDQVEEEKEIPSYDYPFFVDPAYDEILNSVDQHIDNYQNNQEISEALNNSTVEFSGNPTETGLDSEWPVEIEGGEAAVDVKMSYDQNTGQVKFDFNILDVGAPLEEIDYDPESQMFSYYCSTCDLEHEESLTQVFNSLCVVTGMISQLQHINKKQRQGISDAFQTLEDNLRLLSHFVSIHLEENHDHDGDEDEDDDSEEIL